MRTLRDLDAQLRGLPTPDGTRMEELRRRLRLAYLEGAEDWSRRELQRPLAVEEVEGVVRRYPGD